MEQNTKSVFRQQLPVYVVQLALCAIMVCVYLLIRRYTTAVLLGAIAGALISLLNYTAMIFSLLRAEQSEDPQRGQLKVQGNYVLRTILMMGALLLAVKVFHTEPIATVLPIVLMRIALFIGSLLIKNPEQKPIHGYKSYEEVEKEEMQ